MDKKDNMHICIVLLSGLLFATRVHNTLLIGK